MKSKKTVAKNKATFVFFVALALFFWAIIYLVQWQIVRGEELKTRAMDQSLRSTALTANRGTIYDATGDKVLAQSASVWTVVLEPNYIKEDETCEKIAAGLAPILGMEKDVILEKTKQNSYFTYLKRKIETETKEQILAFIKEQDIKRGVRFLEDYKRYYPYGSTASVVLGFTGTDNTGLLGLEMEYEKELLGTKGRMVSAKNGIGTDMPFQYEQLVDAQDGYDLVLTLDETVQSVLEKKLEEAVVKEGVLEGATAVMMNVKTGAILGLAVADNFDLNDPFTIANENTRVAINALPADEQDAAYTAALNKQWRNKAVSDTYYPGSVFKMATAAMAIDSGLLSKTDTFECNGSYNVAGEDMRCWNFNHHGTQTVVEGICNSCNPFFMQVGLRMGAHNFFKYFEAFGFTEKTGIDLPGEAGSIYYSENKLNPVELATEAFGQNFSITPLQMITAAAAIANGGYIVQPHVVDRMLDSEGNIVQSTENKYKRQVISKETASFITGILQQNVVDGTGKNGNVAGYRVCGKTGTSEKVAKYWEDPSKGMSYIASFCGYAPAEDPQYALLIYLDEPTNGASGGAQAAPIFANAMKELLPYLGVESQLTASEYKDQQTHAPNVAGKTLAEAKAIVEEDGLYYEIYGDRTEDSDVVLMQIPTPGATMPKDGKVILCTTDSVSEADMVVVPNFTERGMADCNDIAAELDIQVIFTGASTSGDIRAQNQDVVDGQKVKPGTVITLTLVDYSGIE